MMRNLSGSRAATGRVLIATGLYFRFAANIATCSDLLVQEDTAGEIVTCNTGVEFGGEIEYKGDIADVSQKELNTESKSKHVTERSQAER
jgi:hypothetical protein